MSIHQDTTLRQQTTAALQDAATLLKQNKEEAAYGILHQSIRKPYQEGILSEGQMNAVYRSILPDPHAPETEFAKKQFKPLLILKAQALRDCVAHYSKIHKQMGNYESYLPELYDNKAKAAILQAASLLEKNGDMEGAWKILNDVLPAQMREKYPGITDEIVKDVYRIMNDSFRTPTSTFLQNRIKENPQMVDDNRLRARALESVSMHIFDPAVVAGNAPTFTVPAGTSLSTLTTIISRMVLPHSEPKTVSAVKSTSKSLNLPAKNSIKFKREATWQELKDLRQMGIKLNKETLANLRVLTVGNAYIDESDLEWILPLCPNLEVLDLGSAKHDNRISSKCFAIIGNNCPNLLSFTLSDKEYPVHSSQLEELTSKCTKLQHLNLRWCKLCKGSLAAVAKNCPDLRSIDISYNSRDIEDSDIQDLVRGCKRITDFKAEGIAFEDEALKALAQCPLLRSLKLSSCYLRGGGGSAFTVAGMQELVRKCRALTDIELNSCGLGDDHLRVLGEAGLPLTRISLCRNSLINQDAPIAGYSALLQGNPRLREMHMQSNGLEDNFMEAVAEHCPLVTTLDVSQNSGITSQGLAAIAAPKEGVVPVEARCAHLTDLRMRGFGEENQEGYLQALTDSPLQLTRIDFNANPNTTAQEMIDFVRKNPGLKHIELPSDHVTDEVLFAIGQSCPLLESLEGLGETVTPNGIKALGRGCPHLHKLKATHLRNDGDGFLRAIGNTFSELTHLDISYSRTNDSKPLFSREGFITLCKGCRKLSDLNVSNCFMNESTVELIGKLCPTLKKIDYTGPIGNGGAVRTLKENCPGIIVRCTTGYNTNETF